MIIERTRFCRLPKPTLTNDERLELWRRKYQRVPVEATLPKPAKDRAK